MKQPIAWIMIALLLAACGQKGSLMRPSDAAREQQEQERKAAEKNGSL